MENVNFFDKALKLILGLFCVSAFLYIAYYIKEKKELSIKTKIITSSIVIALMFIAWQIITYIDLKNVYISNDACNGVAFNQVETCYKNLRIRETQAAQMAELSAQQETWVSEKILTEIVVEGCPFGCYQQKPDCDIKAIPNPEDNYYHYFLPGDAHYDEYSLNLRYRGVWFCTEEEAIRNGYDRARY